ncbi:WD40-repeat-containing domain protein [Cladochytrium replicatum]|nr:WD40-repeat-containing domain protein [Cladochytrium replicatum]
MFFVCLCLSALWISSHLFKQAEQFLLALQYSIISCDTFSGFDMFSPPSSAVQWAPSHPLKPTELLFVTGSNDDGRSAVSLHSYSPPHPSLKRSSENRTPPPSTLISHLHSYPHNGGVTDLSFAPGDSPTFVTSSTRGEIHTYSIIDDTSSTVSSPRFSIHHIRSASPFKSTAAITGVAIQTNIAGPSDPDVAIVNEKGVAAIVKLETMQPVYEASGSKADARYLCEDVLGFTGVKWRTSNQIATINSGGRLSIWDVRQKRSAMVLESSQKSSGFLSIAVHPGQADKLATGTTSGGVILWDIRFPNISTTSSQIAPTVNSESRVFSVHKSDVWDLQFHPTNPSEILTCSEDGSIGAVDWNRKDDLFYSPNFSSLSDRRQFKVLESNRLSINAIDCHPEKSTVVAVGDSGKISIIPLA